MSAGPLAASGPAPGIAAVARAALALVSQDARLGLGSGHAAAEFIACLGRSMKDGLRVSGVATSRAAAAAAAAAGVPLIDLTEGMVLDLTIDGADEVTPTLDLVKGWGGALVRERIVAQASRAQVILVGPEKLVPMLGARGRIPVEVIPFATAHVAGAIRMFGLTPSLRRADDDASPFVTDNGNVLLDCAPALPLASAAAARELERRLLAIAGVVDTGLFLGTAERVLVGYPDGHVDVMAGLPGRVR